MTQRIGTVLAGLAFTALASQANAAGTTPISHMFNVSVTIDQTLFSSSYRFAGPGGGELLKGKLSQDMNGHLTTHTPIRFTVWETTADGSTERQVQHYQMRLTDVNAVWWAENTVDEPIPADLISPSIDGAPVQLNTDIEIDSRAAGSNVLSVESTKALPERTSTNSNIKVSLVAMFVNKIS